jgi:hypothetical protein
MSSEEVRTVLAERADAVDATRPERVDELFGRIHRQQRQRTAAAVASATCLVLALVAGLALLASGTRDAAPPPADPDQRKHSNDSVHTQLTQRRLTYAMGSTLHWGARSIDVGQPVQAVGATDDGVVFVRGDDTCRYQVACRTLWFTDGGEPVRIGTVAGSWIRGFRIAFASAGSTLVWSEQDPTVRDPRFTYAETGEIVVYDTSVRREVGRFGSARSMRLAVGDGTVYWVPNQGQCVEFDGECVRFTDPIMRFDAATGQQAAVSWESYWATRRGWPRTLMSPPHAKEIVGGKVVRPRHADPSLSDSFGFQLHGTRLVAGDRGVAVTVRLARTGAPLQLRMPARYPSGSYFGITQWLDDDHVVMWAEDGALLVCRLPDGRCQTAVRHGGITGFGGRG